MPSSSSVRTGSGRRPWSMQWRRNSDSRFFQNFYLNYFIFLLKVKNSQPKKNKNPLNHSLMISFWQVFEVNPSSAREGRQVWSQLQEATQSHQLHTSRCQGSTNEEASIRGRKEDIPKTKAEGKEEFYEGQIYFQWTWWIFYLQWIFYLTRETKIQKSKKQTHSSYFWLQSSS